MKTAKERAIEAFNNCRRPRSKPTLKQIVEDKLFNLKCKTQFLWDNHTTLHIGNWNISVVWKFCKTHMDPFRRISAQGFSNKTLKQIFYQYESQPFKLKVLPYTRPIRALPTATTTIIKNSTFDLTSQSYPHGAGLRVRVPKRIQ